MNVTMNVENIGSPPQSAWQERLSRWLAERDREPQPLGETGKDPQSLAPAPQSWPRVFPGL